MAAVLSHLGGHHTTSFHFGSVEDSYQAPDQNAALAQELRGKKIHVDMTKSFDRWPAGARHPEYQRLSRETDSMLER